MEDNYIRLLNHLGFSKNEAKVYLALLKKNTSQVAELVAISGVPQKMIYYTLQKLMHRGLCTLVPGKVKKYKPTDPNVGIENIIVEHEQQYDAARQMLKNLRTQYDDGKNETNPLEYIEFIQNPAQISEKFCSIIKRTTKEILAFTKGPYVTKWKTSNDTVQDTIIESMKKGLVVKSIYELKDLGEPEQWVKKFTESGEEIRITDELPLKMILFDEKTVFLSLRDKLTSAPSLTSMIIDHEDMAKAFKIIFYSIWEKSITLNEYMNRAT